MDPSPRFTIKTEILKSYSSNSLVNLARANTVSKDLSCSNINGVGKPEVYPDDCGSRRSITSQKAQTSNRPSPLQILKNFSNSVFTQKQLNKKLPILKWSREYNLSKFIADIIAGLTVGLTILPQGLAYAGIAGLDPQYGLYSGFVGSFVYFFFGGNDVATIGPTAIMAIVTLSYTHGQSAPYSVLLCFLTGVVTLLMGIFQMGFICNFISTPVINSFTSAAALTICSTQIKALFGLHFKANGFREVMFGTMEHFNDVQRNDAILSAVCIAILVLMQNLQWLCRRFTKTRPALDRFLWFVATSRSVIVILICTVVFSMLDDHIFPVNVIGTITPGFPPIQTPQFVIYRNVSDHVVGSSVLELMRKDGSALIVLPLLALMEHITICKKFPGNENSMTDVSQELIAIGLTNIVGSFFSSMPVSGSFSRSTVNAASGAKSPFGGLITGTMVILALAFLTPSFHYIPNAALAAVIVSAVIFTVDFSIIPALWKSKKMDLIPWTVTFFTSLCLSLEVGILSGICISVTFLLYYAARPAVQIQRAETAMGNEFVIVALDRSLVFPSIEYIRYMVMKSRSTWAKGLLPVVVDCKHIQYCDYSAAKGIRDLFVTFNEKKQMLVLWRAKPSIIRILKGTLDYDGVPFHYCMKEDELKKLVDASMDGDDRPIEFNATIIANDEKV